MGYSLRCAISQPRGSRPGKAPAPTHRDYLSRCDRGIRWSSILFPSLLSCLFSPFPSACATPGGIDRHVVVISATRRLFLTVRARDEHVLFPQKEKHGNTFSLFIKFFCIFNRSSASGVNSPRSLSGHTPLAKRQYAHRISIA